MSQPNPDIRSNPAPAKHNYDVRKSSKGIRLSSIDFIRPNPLDTFWRIAIGEGYDKERISTRELHISVPGLWCDHHIALSWSAADEELQLILAFDTRVPGGRTDTLCRLMSLLNERVAVGHFDFWQKDEALVYRHSMSLAGEARLSADQAMAMVASALAAADKGYPACQYVIWAGMNPQEALDTALMERAARL